MVLKKICLINIYSLFGDSENRENNYLKIRDFEKLLRAYVVLL
jgi:hypothetical protein